MQIYMDLAGTISDNSARWDTYQQDYDWQAYFDAAPYDLPRLEIVELIHSYLPTKITIVCGRPMRYAESTKAWLARYNIPYEKIWMRPDDFKAPNHIYKAWLVEQRLVEQDCVFFDDQLETVNALRDAGVCCAVWTPYER